MVESEDDAIDLIESIAIRWRRQRKVLGVRTARTQPAVALHDPEGWQQLLTLGWPGIVAGSEVGGSGMGARGLATLSRELGRSLEPFPLRTSAIAAAAIEHSGSQQADVVCSRIIGDGLIAVPALCGSGPSHVCAKETDVGFRLSGSIRHVEDGALADAFLVPISLHHDPEPGLIVLLERSTPRLEISNGRFIDGYTFADLCLTDLVVDRSAIIASGPRAAKIWCDVSDLTVLGLAAEMLGAGLEALDRTIAHLNLRHQFGQPLSAFQALRHRAARLYCRLAMATTAVAWAAEEFDSDGADRGKAISSAKVICGEAFELAAAEMIQMHGGVGMTDDHDAGLFLKRARVTRILHGSASCHLDRYATAHGF